MITVPTVLVLGAGASHEYGFPLGRGLIKHILSANLTGSGQVQISPGKYVNPIWNGLGVGDVEFVEFRQVLKAANPPSIDAFLEDRNDSRLTLIGKAAIGMALIPCEVIASLDWLNEEHWYDYLWAHLRSRPEEFSNNKLSIITFNYDRSVEYFLFRRLQHAYNLSTDAAALLTKTVEVVHMYGQLGVPSFWDSATGRDYDTDVSVDSVRKCIDGIKVISERSDEAAEFKRARELLMQAERICFLGFGYDVTNTQRLGINQFNIAIFGTAVGMGASDIQQAIQRIGTGTMVQGIVLRRFNVLDALKNFPVLLDYEAGYDESLVDKQLHGLG